MGRLYLPEQSLSGLLVFMTFGVYLAIQESPSVDSTYKKISDLVIAIIAISLSHVLGMIRGLLSEALQGKEKKFGMDKSICLLPCCMN